VPALLSLLVLGLTDQKPATADFPWPIAKPARSIKEVMIDDLADPKVQAALGVNSTQIQLQNVRIAQEAMKLAFAMLRNSVSDDRDKGLAANFSLSTTSGSCLFPFLNEPQVARLRRLAVRDMPLQALGTNEVAYALELTASQQSRIDVIRTDYYMGYLKADRPSVRSLKAALTKIAAASAKMGEPDGDGPTPEDVDKMQALMLELFKAFERSIRLSAKEKPIPAPNVLRLLTPAQTRRYRELSRG
jgi:hypothetical protein